MKELIIKGNNVEIRLENGLNARGEFYYKNGKMYTQANTSWDLSQLMKYKKEIEKALA